MLNKVLMCILSFNRQPFLKRCIETFLPYTSEPVDLIIVDNGSKEPTLNFLKKLEDKKLANGTNIKIIYNPYNFGIPKALNQALALRDPSQHFFKLDNDMIGDVNYPRWLTDMIECIELSPYNDNVKIIGLSPFKEGRYWKKHVYLTNGKAFEVEDPDPNTILGPGHLIHKDVFLKIPNYDERGFLYGYDDTNFFLKAKKLGFKSVYHFRCKAVHGDDLSLLESSEHTNYKNLQLQGRKDLKNYDSTEYSEDNSELKIVFEQGEI
jgi:GT2 family glycosyltransferase